MLPSNPKYLAEGK